MKLRPLTRLGIGGFALACGPEQQSRSTKLVARHVAASGDVSRKPELRRTGGRIPVIRYR